MKKKTLATLTLAAAAALPSMALALGAQDALHIIAQNQYVAVHDLQKQ